MAHDDKRVDAAFWYVQEVLGVSFVFEYVFRAIAAQRWTAYVCSWWGFVDLLSGVSAIGDFRCARDQGCLKAGTWIS